jgi:hypothetical protein
MTETLATQRRVDTVQMDQTNTRDWSAQWHSIALPRYKVHHGVSGRLWG